MYRLFPLAAVAFVLAVTSAGSPPVAVAQDKAEDRKTETGSDKLTEDQRIHHFLNRFTLGATPALMAEVKKMGMKKWLKAQLAGKNAEPASLKEALANMKSLTMTLQEVSDTYVVEIGKDTSPKERRKARQTGKVPEKEMLNAIIMRSVLSNNHIKQTSSDFFRNHFAVSVDKGAVSLLAGNWEQEVIQGNALGTFPGILKATAHHPAMLFFLDNHLSCRPATAAELERINKRGKNFEKKLANLQQRGLNENYARELLELHTLGVDNYYTQEDVIEVAKAITGWTITPRRLVKKLKKPFGFLFVPQFHSTGDKIVLGQTIKENKKDPQAEGEAVLELLAAHKGTAEYLSKKLCIWFVNDEPSDAMVKRIAAVFTKTKGDLPAIYMAIFEDPDFFSTENYLAKYKRPFEFVISALRATGASVQHPEIIHRQLKAMNEDLYRCADPTGYYDQAEAWQDPGAMSIRWKFAHDLARGKFFAVNIPVDFYSDLPLDKPETWGELLAAKLLCQPMSEKTSTALKKLIARKSEVKTRRLRKELGPLLVAGILGSPEFQKQ